MLMSCGVGEDSWESLQLQRSNQSILNEISPKYSLEGRCWGWNSNTLATWCKQLTHWKRPWSCERLKAGGEGDDRGWDDWMALPTWWTWVWASSESCWWTGKPGVLQYMGSQIVETLVEHDRVTELNWCLCITTRVLLFISGASELMCGATNLIIHYFHSETCI